MNKLTRKQKLAAKYALHLYSVHVVNLRYNPMLLYSTERYSCIFAIVRKNVILPTITVSLLIFSSIPTFDLQLILFSWTNPVTI